MAATAQSQHRCVFVGNIPYDATEEQLVQICEEVGPVVSFRLVTDRETGKPKGYGFCEYKDEETALSARRNLQGYEINGRQLRVDFAENDKNSDRNRSEQGRGGPGTVPNVGPGHQNFNLPMGDSVSMAAATVMAGALGSAQTASMRNQIGLQSQPLMGTDPLTRHLAKLSRTQLTEVISELKAMATQDKERARNLLLAIPNLPKAIFQAEIMLGLVSQQMLMMPNIRQTSAQPVVQPMVQSVQTLSGLPPLPQNKVPSLQPCAQDSRVSTGVPIQYAEQFPAQVQTQRLPLMQNQVQQGHLQVQAVQHSLAQGTSAVSPLKSGYNDQSRYPIAGTHPLVMHPHLSAAGIQEKVDLQGHNASVVHGKRVLSHSIDQMDSASKLMKLNEGRVSPLQTSAQPSIPLPISGVQTKQDSRVEAVVPEKQATQIQLPAYLNTAAVRQQVLNLASEQLDSLTPDQLQQLFQLQQMLRQAT